MKISLIGESFSGESGIGPWRYNHEILTALKKKGLDVRIVESNAANRRLLLAINSFTVLPYRTFRAVRSADLAHATDPSSAIFLPVSGRKTLVTVHDLMPVFYRQQFGIADRIFSRLVFSAITKCKKIIASSYQTKSDLMRYMRVSPQKIEVINLGVSDRFRILPSVNKEAATIGFVGSLNKRKRADFVIKGFDILRRKYIPTARFVIVGRGAERENLETMVRKLNLEDAVQFVSSVRDEDLVLLYNKFSVLVIPSDYEGFGFPIVEAQKCGTPVIVRKHARISPEVVSSCVKVDDEEDMADSVRNLLSDGNYYREVVEAGISAAGQFTWEKYADQLIGVYERLAAN